MDGVATELLYRATLIPLFLKQLSVRSEFYFSKAALISTSAPLKLVPLSLYTLTSGPCLLTNLVKALVKELVVRLWVISICPAQIARYVNTQT